MTPLSVWPSRSRGSTVSVGLRGQGTVHWARDLRPCENRDWWLVELATVRRGDVKAFGAMHPPVVGDGGVPVG
jgi:hypothetical protein